jgi:AcrR family transcriptional regulator
LTDWSGNFGNVIDQQPGDKETAMAKATRQGESEARGTILDATTALLRERRTGNVTTDEVAKRAGCAKGLVHYHFKRKDQLLAAAAARLWDERSTAWSAALGGADPKASINAAWDQLRAEASSGTAAVCVALGLGSDELVVQSVNSARSALARSMTTSIGSLLGRMGLEPSVPASELGTLLTATAEGIAMQLGSGAKAADLEQAWAAFWVGLLSLTRPGRS